MVYEKDTSVHQFIEISSCQPLTCKTGIPFSQAKRYRRITSNDDYLNTRIPRNAVSRLPALFHKIEVNL